MWCSLEGCETVAGGRSVAETTGDDLHPGGVQDWKVILPWAQPFSSCATILFSLQKNDNLSSLTNGGLDCILIWVESSEE